ncbi:hypothetical protein CfE428DRAFT_4297 [Chthoniobacter flavus Ellin428]|uniref:Uncharacterized protein n=1 Tax=Chthoniobacter flavus Ellin428 TaxID=497964 RepID=B4D5V8_9BACT|nr:hypothetical protein [Chthoniobacter flavus]EDY18161.1 hypothetical protein CfE428DRAFT_4297 [Chthoniobacter flavus Ellin428]TCO91485.1 hypothetical protein EV701_108213 [Chthoniobacter flavus]
MSDTSPTPPPTSITLCDIVTVLIRLLAIEFGLSSLSGLTWFYGPQLRDRFHQPTNLLVFDAVLPIVCLLIVYWLWCLAGWVARRVTKGHNAALSATQLTLLDLYSFGFFLVGLYVAVTNFGPSLTWLHYTLSHSSTEGRLTPQQEGDFYTLFKYLVKLIVGLALVLNGRKLATKLIKRYHAPAAKPSGENQDTVNPA